MDSAHAGGSQAPNSGVWGRESNKTFERHLHAECRSFLYYVPPMGDTSDLSYYDSADRLLAFHRGLLNDGGQSIKQSLTLPGVDFQRSYNPDLTGNWVDNGLSGSFPAVQYAHDCTVYQSQSRTTNNLNQVATVNGGPPDYDVKGNMTGFGGMSFGYDAFNRLVSASGTGPNGQVSASYSYDALNRRVLKSGPATIRFAYDGNRVVEEQDLSDTTLRQYVWGQYIDELIQQREFQRKTEPGPYNDWYPLSDLLYRSAALTDEHICKNASVHPFYPHFVEAYDTDVYGRTKVYQGPGKDKHWFSDDDTTTTDPLCRYIYTGREYDPETGLYYYRARYYHPALGRFISRDPLLYDGGDMNLYRYAAGNPLVNVDPDGEFFWIALAALAVVGYIAYESIWGAPTAAPGLGTSLIPIYGSSQAAIHDFQTGHWGWGIFNTALAVSDIFLVKSLITSAGRFLVRGGIELGGKLVGESGVELSESAIRRNATRDFAEYMQFRTQGYSAKQAFRLTRSYEGMGQHFVQRQWIRRMIRGYGENSIRGRFLSWFQDSALNVLSGRGMSTGRFYELHARLHGLPAFGERWAQTMRITGGTWEASRVAPALRPVGKVGYLIESSPEALKLVGFGSLYTIGHTTEGIRERVERGHQQSWHEDSND